VLLRGQFGAPPRDEIEPRGSGGDEVQGEAGMPLRPALDGRTLVGCVVIQNPMHGQTRKDGRVRLLQELLELLGAVAPAETSHHLARGQVEGRKQAGCPVPGVIMAPAFGGAGEQRDAGVHPVEGLNRGLLIDTEDHGLCPRRTDPSRA
jgi:hypothetical protein